MKKEKVNYLFRPYKGKVLNARKEISYEFQLTARLVLDEICFSWNKNVLEERINQAIDSGNIEEFIRVRKEYLQYIWE